MCSTILLLSMSIVSVVAGRFPRAGVNVAGYSIDLAGAREPETNNAHHHRRGQFKTLILSNPIRKEFGQAQVLANTRCQSFAAKGTPDDPCFQSTKPAAQLDAVIHIVDLRADRIAKVEVLGGEGKETPQTPEITAI